MPAKNENKSTSPSVLVDNRKVYVRAFDDEAIRLYIPVDEDGNLTKTNATNLICWSMGDATGYRKGELAKSDLAVSDLLLWHPEDVQNEVRIMAKLSQCVPFKTIGKMNDWLSQLARNESFDIELNPHALHGTIWVRN